MYKERLHELKIGLFSAEQFTTYGPEIGAEKGHFISAFQRPLTPNNQEGLGSVVH